MCHGKVVTNIVDNVTPPLTVIVSAAIIANVNPAVIVNVRLTRTLECRANRTWL